MTVLFLEKYAQYLPRTLCNFSNKYQHLLLYLSLENVLKVCLGNNALLKCLSQQYGPALMVACCLGFRALGSSRNRALHQSLKLISVFIFHFSLFSPSCSLELEPSQTPPGNSCLSPKNLFLDNRAQMKSQHFYLPYQGYSHDFSPLMDEIRSWPTDLWLGSNLSLT